MILPIIAYGDPILRKVGVEIAKDYPNLSELIENMKETMVNAQGVGLAAPQIGKAIRLFIIDTSPPICSHCSFNDSINLLERHPESTNLLWPTDVTHGFEILHLWGLMLLRLSTVSLQIA